MNIFPNFLLLVGSLAVAAIPVGAQTAEAFSNFGAGDAYNGSTGYTISSSGTWVGGAYTLAMGFTASSGGYLDSLDLALNSLAGPGLIDVSLRGDVGGNLGSVLESWLGISVVHTPGGFIYTLSSENTPQLSAGSSYWLVTAASGSNVVAGWNHASTGDVGLRSMSLNGAPFSAPSVGTQGAFRVTVSAIPEPSTYAALFGAAALGLVAWRRRVKR